MADYKIYYFNYNCGKYRRLWEHMIRIWDQSSVGEEGFAAERKEYPKEE